MKKKLEEENAKLRAQVAMQNSAANDEPRKRGQSAVKTPTKERNPAKPTTPQKSPAVSRNAKKKWEMLERKVCCVLFNFLLTEYIVFKRRVLMIFYHN